MCRNKKPVSLGGYCSGILLIAAKAFLTNVFITEEKWELTPLAIPQNIRQILKILTISVFLNWNDYWTQLGKPVCCGLELMISMLWGHAIKWSRDIGKISIVLCTHALPERWVLPKVLLQRRLGFLSLSDCLVPIISVPMKDGMTPLLQAPALTVPI